MRALTLLVLMSAVPAVAQSPLDLVRQFVPLDVGNAWTYAHSYTYCEHVAVGGGCTTTDTTLVYTVVGERVAGDDTLAVVEGPGTVALLGFVAADHEGVRVIREVVEGEARPYFAVPPIPPDFPSFFLESGVHDEEVEIGGAPYRLPVLRGYIGDAHVFGIGVGPLELFSQQVGSGGVRWQTSYRLVGARVRGEAYGNYATSTGPAPPSRTALALWPNPSADRATASVELAAPAMLRVDLLDGLGRVVASWELAARAGTREVPLDLGGLPVGIYAVRVRADGAFVGTARVTKGR